MRSFTSLSNPASDYLITDFNFFCIYNILKSYAMAHHLLVDFYAIFLIFLVFQFLDAKEFVIRAF